MTSATIDQRPVQWWQRYQRVLLVVFIVILGAIIVAALSNQTRRGYLDPEGVNESGARAAVRLLESQGVAVTQARTVAVAAEAASAGGTLVVTTPDLLRPEQVRQLRATGADLVLIAPEVTVAEFSDRISTNGDARPDSLEPDCDLPEAERAGTARMGGVVYYAEAPAVSCYPVAGDATLVDDRIDDGGRLIVLGSAEPIMNRYLDDEGNAALVLGLLGRHPDLVWYRPTLEDFDAGQPTPLTELMPDWVRAGAWQLAIAALLAAWWQGRRLGRIVPEPLPVVIRAAETTEGRARLYRRGRARDHAGATLRAAASDRLRSRLALPRDADPAATAEAVAARTSRSEAEVNRILFGPEPPDETSLVRLASDLDNLEQEVRSR
jgi:hypothetical protein